MDRLTHKTPNVPAVPVNFVLDFVLDLDDETWHGLSAIFERLAEYEGTGLSPEQIKELGKGLTEGRLLVLPCGIGTPVWVHEQLCSRGKQLTYDGCKYSQDCMRDNSIKCPLRAVKRAFTVNMRKGLGITFWLTKKEAEDAIPQDRRDGNHGND